MLEASSEVLLKDLHKIEESNKITIEEFKVPNQNIVLNKLENDDPLSETSSDSFLDLD